MSWEYLGSAQHAVAGSGFQQTLSAVFTANTAYTLTVEDQGQMDSSTQRFTHTTGATFRAAGLVAYRNQGEHSRHSARSTFPHWKHAGGAASIRGSPTSPCSAHPNYLPFPASIGSTALVREICSGVAGMALA